MTLTNEFSFTPEELADLERPIGEARGLPGKAYEQHQLFPRTWCAIGSGSEIPQPGDVMAVDLAGWPLLMVRGDDANIRF